MDYTPFPFLLYMKNYISKNRDLILAAAILLGLLVIVFKDVIFFDYVFVKRDISRYYYPIRTLITNIFRSGQIPLWNPHLFCGLPLHAAIQHSVFYPLSLIYYILGTTKGLSLFIIVHIFLSGFFMYLFTRSRNISEQGSLLSAITFAFSGYIMSALNLTIALCAVAWFPLAMMLFLKGIRARSYKYSIGLGVVLTLMFLAGDPSIVISTIAIILFASVYIFIERYIKNSRADTFVILNLLITAGCFLLFGAFQILPAIEYYTRTIRLNMGWNESSLWSIPYSDLLSLIIPYFNDLSYAIEDYWMRQSWLDNYYAGITTIILAAFALGIIRKSRLVQFLTAIALITLSICFGKYFIVYPLIYKVIPTIRMIRYPVRFFFICTFSISALAGIGYDCMRKIMVSQRAKKIAAASLFIGFLSALFAIAITFFAKDIAVPIIAKWMKAYGHDPAFNYTALPSLVYANIFNLRRTLLYISCFGLFLFLWPRTRNKKIISLAIFITVIFDLMLTNTGYEPTVEESYFKEPTPNIRYVMGDKSLFRICASPYSMHRFSRLTEKSYHKGIESSKDRFVTNRMLEFGIYDMWGYDSTVLRRPLEVIKPLYNLKSPASTDLLNLLNVKYFSSHGGTRAYGYRKVHETPDGAVYLNTRYLPRAFLVRKVISVDSDNQALEYMLSKEFNPKKEIILEEEFAFTRNGPGSDAERRRDRIKKDKVDILRYSPNIVEISVRAKEPAFLLLSDTYYPGWKAYVDGSIKKIYRADYFLRAVEIPEGEHLIKFVYDPFSFRLGASITAIGLLLLLYIFLKRLRLTKHKILSIII